MSDEEDAYSDESDAVEDIETVKAKLRNYAEDYDDHDIRSILLKYASMPKPQVEKEKEDPDYSRIHKFLEQFLFSDAVIEIDEVDVPEPDLESYLAEDTEDEARSDHIIYDGHISWECENYHVEVRPDSREFKAGRPLFRVRVSHKPHLQVQNSGHLYDLHSVEELCNLLEDDQFEHAMLILFATYGGGALNRKPRGQEELDAVISESWVRTTISGLEP